MEETLLIDYIEKMSENLMNFNGNLNLNFIGKLTKMMPKLELLMPALSTFFFMLFKYIDFILYK